MAEEKFYCEKCNRTMNGSEFYTSNNLTKYPTGKFTQCKKCMTMHVDNWNSETFLWILQDADVPWIPDEWNKLMESYAKDPSKLTGTTIVGRYLGKMKLKQFRDFRWKDTEFLLQLSNSKREEAMRRQGYDAAEIAAANEAASFEIPQEELQQPVYDEPAKEEEEDYFALQSGPDIDIDLTDDDRMYLRLKWGKTYKPEEWVWLEQMYKEMMNSYDIQTAGHIDTLKLICKTSLKANQLIDIGDVEGFQKMSKVYDTLMKSGKFTAAQNKSEQGEFVDSVGELIELCEKEGYIERFYVDQPNDKVDITIKDMQKYTYNLIMEETNLGNLIENALKENQKEDKEAAENTEDEIIDFDELEDELLDKDFEDFMNFREEESEEDGTS